MKVNLKFKRRLPFLVIIGIIFPFVYPYIPTRFSENPRLVDRMDYEVGVIMLAVIYFAILLASYYFVIVKNKKKIDNYLKRKQQLEDL